MATQRVLIFIVAYHAEKHIEEVLDRIPADLLSDPDIHFLVLDDASTDQGADLAAGWARKHGVSRFSVLRNPVNQGYGGNQKLGYRLAIERGYDFVVLLHGDGQYAPELLPRFIQSRRETGADVILGSRLREKGSARRGGMPLYKYVGNRILSAVQNGLTDLGLSEFHSGYRGYSTRFLSRIPFEVNTNDFHFDTEILLQAAHIDAQIEEFAVPTHYGDEVCHVNGLSYAYQVLKATIRFRLHRLGILCDLKLRDLQRTHHAAKTQHPYASDSLAWRIFGQSGAKRILDIGCGPRLVAQRCREAGADVQHWHVGDATRWLDTDGPGADPAAADFDLILLLDALEHFEDPERFLVELRARNQGGGPPPLLVISTPNIAFAGVRLNLLLGRFTYAERGILHFHHRRLFTRGSLLRSLRDCGFTVESVYGSPVPFAAVLGGRTGRYLEAFSRLTASLWPSLFAFQTVVVCRPLPGVRQLLGQAEEVQTEAVG